MTTGVCCKWHCEKKAEFTSGVVIELQLSSVHTRYAGIDTKGLLPQAIPVTRFLYLFSMLSVLHAILRARSADEWEILPDCRLLLGSMDWQWSWDMSLRFGLLTRLFRITVSSCS